MAGRPKIYEEDQLIEKATQVFWKKGYNAASAKDLMEAMDIGQGSFYLAFKGGKKELFRKTMMHFSETNKGKFKAALDASDNPIQFIRDFFYTLPNYSEAQKQNGCYLGNAIVELSNLDEETQNLSIRLLNDLERNFGYALIKAQEMGKLAADKSPSLLAKHLINLWNGINVTQRMEENDDAIRRLIAMNLEFLD